MSKRFAVGCVMPSPAPRAALTHSEDFSDESDESSSRTSTELVLCSEPEYVPQYKTMALTRFQNLSPERRQEILQVAAHEFAEHGYEGTSYNELLKKLGMGKSQAYYYFSDKKDLFVTACAACYEAFYDEIALLPDPTNADEYWQTVLSQYIIGFSYQQQHPIAARLTRAIARSPQRFDLAMAVIMGEGSSRELYLEWIHLGQRLGAIRRDFPDDFLVPFCLQTSALVDSWFAERAEKTSTEETERLAVRFTSALRRMLEPSD